MLFMKLKILFRLSLLLIGISRDDAAGFLEKYGRLGILTDDPFVTIDQDGVGELMRIAVERGRATRPSISLGICGEHGGDPRSIEFCERIGLDYASCSPLPGAGRPARGRAGDVEGGRGRLSVG